MRRACQLLGHVSFLEIVTSVGVVFRRIKNVWRKKNLEKYTMYIQCILVSKLHPDFFVLLF